MYMVFGFCNGNANMAKEEYQILYPQRRHPPTRLRKSGTFMSNYNRGRPTTHRPVRLEEHILGGVHVHPIVQHKTNNPRTQYS